MKPDLTPLKRVASIDIGTNTILLLIAEVEERRINPLFEAETVVGLGKGVQKNGILTKEAMNRGFETLSHAAGRQGRPDRGGVADRHRSGE